MKRVARELVKMTVHRDGSVTLKPVRRDAEGTLSMLRVVAAAMDMGGLDGRPGPYRMRLDPRDDGTHEVRTFASK